MQLTLIQLVNLALKPNPKLGAVNLNILRILLVQLITKLKMEDQLSDLDEEQQKQVEKYLYYMSGNTDPSYLAPAPDGTVEAPLDKSGGPILNTPFFGKQHHQANGDARAVTFNKPSEAPKNPPITAPHSQKRPEESKSASPEQDKKVLAPPSKTNSARTVKKPSNTKEQCPDQFKNRPVTAIASKQVQTASGKTTSVQTPRFPPIPSARSRTTPHSHRDLDQPNSSKSNKRIGTETTPTISPSQSRQHFKPAKRFRATPSPRPHPEYGQKSKTNMLPPLENTTTTATTTDKSKEDKRNGPDPEGPKDCKSLSEAPNFHDKDKCLLLEAFLKYYFNNSGCKGKTKESQNQTIYGLTRTKPDQVIKSAKTSTTDLTGDDALPNISCRCLTEHAKSDPRLLAVLKQHPDLLSC